MIEGAPIVGFTGANGAGKTLVAVSECIRDMRRGRPVVSTVPIRWVHPRTGAVLESVPLRSLRQLLELRDCTVLLDEVAVIFSSRGTQTLPGEVEVFLQTLRHKGVTVRWTAPTWMRADVLVRSVTQVSVGVFGLGKIRVQGSFWPRPLLIGAGAMDTTGIPLDARPDKVMKRRVYVPQRLSGWGAYDTHAETPRIGRPASGGYCVDCGGTMRAERCTPDRHQHLGLEPRVQLPFALPDVDQDSVTENGAGEVLEGAA